MKIQSRVGYGVVILLFTATAINYIDRQVIGLLKPYIGHELHWSESDYGLVVTVFQIAYAIGLLISGRMLDKLGVRAGYAIAVIVWSLGAFFHVLAYGVFGFAVARAVLGLGEAANFPAAIKTVAEWFPKKDRALVTGIFNSGSNVGAIVAPLIVGFVTLSLGWKCAFLLTAALGFVWVICWLFFYRAPRRHPRIKQAELDYILSDEASELDANIGWTDLFKYRSTYVLCLVRFLTDWVWWFFLFWTPDFLSRSQHLDLKFSVLPLVVIYSMAGIGSILGGAGSSRLIAAGRSVDSARKTAMLCCAVLVLPLFMVTQSQQLWIAVLIIGIAVAAHQGWSSNVLTAVSDIYPKAAVASMTGLAGFTGAIGGAFAALSIGFVLQITGSYLLIFAIAGTMYIIAWLIFKFGISLSYPVTAMR